MRDYPRFMLTYSKIEQISIDRIPVSTSSQRDLTQSDDNKAPLAGHIVAAQRACSTYTMKQVGLKDMFKIAEAEN